MTDSLPSTIPSLAKAFEAEREALRLVISSQDLSSAQSVLHARRALDRTGEIYAKNTQDVQLQKAGLWLLEMVKSGAGVLDQGVNAEVVWKEVPSASLRVIAGSTLFYSAAMIFFIAGYIQASRLTMITALALIILRFFDPKDWKRYLRKIPFLGRKKTPRLDAPGGQAFLADTHISVSALGYVDALADALNTADHILLRLSEPAQVTHWRDDGRLMGFVQNLLEAKATGDDSFVMKLIDRELQSILASEGIEIIHYSSRTKKLFDVLPALDMDEKSVKQGAPALLIGERVLRRGTIWQEDK